jgi:N-methylhydantoinase A/oxoprolinase/acetone carboxylase beta subunit
MQHIHLITCGVLGVDLKAVPVWEKGKAEARHSRLGLGIDAGGTYTDAVIYDFTARKAIPDGTSDEQRNDPSHSVWHRQSGFPQPDQIVQKAKALTTKWDYTIGIEEALDKLDPRHLRSVNLVSVSTTLATNAIVEGRGQEVGLLVMPPFGWTELENFKHSPTAIIQGQMGINGQEKIPVDPSQVREVVLKMIETQQVKAFAVAGYAGHVNPSHELLVKRIVREETGLPVTCGHDVSEGLNYRVRSETAALNARIIPYLDSLFQKVQVCLRRRGINAPVMVVKSDGSLTSLEMARERPIETVLSGPAASVAGVRHLTRCSDAVVIDIGGTTSDTAIIEEGVVKIRERGAIVGGWETHVKALDMRTLGLGGDSLITWREGQITVGPLRVVPVSWLVSHQPRALEAIRWIDRHLSVGEVSSRSLELIALNGFDKKWNLDRREERIVEVLREGPRSVQQLASLTDSVAWQLLPLKGLEDRHIIQRCGLTPTDLLHVLGRVNLWNGEAAHLMCGIFGRLQRMDPEAFARAVIGRVNRLVAKELLKKRLESSVEVRDLESSPVAMMLIDRAFEGKDLEEGVLEGVTPKGGKEGLEVNLRLGSPVVGIGAPAYQFLPDAARLLNTEAIVPPHADVANAIGAITSSVYVHRQVTISIDERGIYHLKGVAEAPTFESLDRAQEYAIEHLKGIVQEMARKAGTSQTEIEIIVDDKIGTLADGSGVFLGRTLEARLSGQPDIARLKASS